jgi:signal transduction histidine kinase
MSHELRTPLNAVIGYAEILEETLGEAQRHADARDAKKISGAARTLLTLINDILDLSKIEAGKMMVIQGPANLRDLVADVVSTTAHIAERNGDEVLVNLSFDRDVVLTDGFKVRQCLLNLMSNACKFTEQGAVTLTATLEGDDLRFDVTDSGCGISAEDAANLFQPFVQADGGPTRKQGGTGLGLVITQRMAQLLGGDVALRSQPGEGSTFTLSVKVGHADAPADAALRRLEQVA